MAPTCLQRVVCCRYKLRKFFLVFFSEPFNHLSFFHINIVEIRNLCASSLSSLHPPTHVQAFLDQTIAWWVPRYVQAVATFGIAISQRRRFLFVTFRGSLLSDFSDSCSEDVTRAMRGQPPANFSHLAEEKFSQFGY